MYRFTMVIVSLHCILCRNSLSFKYYCGSLKIAVDLETCSSGLTSCTCIALISCWTCEMNHNSLLGLCEQY